MQPVLPHQLFLPLFFMSMCREAAALNFQTLILSILTQKTLPRLSPSLNLLILNLSVAYCLFMSCLLSAPLLLCWKTKQFLSLIVKMSTGVLFVCLFCIILIPNKMFRIQLINSSNKIESFRILTLAQNESRLLFSLDSYSSGRAPCSICQNS